MAVKSNEKIFIFSLVLMFSIVFLSRAQEKKEKKEEPVTALLGGTVIDGTGAGPVVNATVLVQGAKILAVGPAAAIKVPKGANVIDVHGKFVLPGFIDCHTHITSETDQLEYYTDTNSLAALRGLQLMNFYLKSGVTAIRDVGSPI